MPPLGVALVIAAAILAAAGIATNVWLVTREVRVVGHETVDAVMGRLSEVQLAVYDVGKDFTEFRQQLRTELDGLHVRLEALEEWKREQGGG